jgi:SIR2-like domain
MENTSGSPEQELAWAVKSEIGAFEKNPLVRSIVNFNIDAVFREYVEARYGGRLVRTIERPSKEPDRKRVSVYYMHGFLRFDDKAGNQKKEASDKLVLAEHEYFDFFNNPTGLFNHTFLYLLREHACLFIGLSMRDDNVRRLLHYSTKDRVQAYREEGEALPVGKARALRHFAILQRYGSELLDRAVEGSLAELGTQVLWVDAYTQIPDRLGTMYEATGQQWSPVYEAAAPAVSVTNSFGHTS